MLVRGGYVRANLSNTYELARPFFRRLVASRGEVVSECSSLLTEG